MRVVAPSLPSAHRDTLRIRMPAVEETASLQLEEEEEAASVSGSAASTVRRRHDAACGTRDHAVNLPCRVVSTSTPPARPSFRLYPVGRQLGQEHGGVVATAVRHDGAEGDGLVGARGQVLQLEAQLGAGRGGRGQRGARQWRRGVVGHPVASWQGRQCWRND